MLIDTSIVRQINFDLQSAAMQTLKKLAKEGVVTVLTTDITLREIEARIDESVMELATTLRKASGIASSYLKGRGPKYDLVTSSFDDLELRTALKKDVRDYFGSGGMEVLEASKGNAAPIFDDYFGRKPPFGEGKKKSEFPDAFVLAALEQWAKKHGIIAEVVSLDGDLAEACKGNEHLVHSGALSVTVQKLLEEREKLVTSVSAMVQTAVEQLTQAVAQSVTETWLYVDEPESEVEDVQVHNVEITDIAVVEIHKGRAVIECTAHVLIEAEASYADTGTASYDSEDKSVFYRRHLMASIEQDDSLHVQFEVMFGDDLKKYKVAKVVINRGRGIKLYPDPDERTHWK